MNGINLTFTIVMRGRGVLGVIWLVSLVYCDFNYFLCDL